MKKILFLVALFLLIGCGGEGAPAERPANEAVEEATAVPVEETTNEGVDDEDAAEAVADEDAAGEETAVYTIGDEPSQPRTFAIVAEESQASYLVDEEFFDDALSKFGIQPGEVDVIGSTNEISGELVLDFGNAELLESGSFVVNLVSLQTDQNQRDRFIRNNFLESNKFPEATFTATAVSNLPATYTEGETISFDLMGELAIRDVVQTVTFNTEAMLQNGTLTGVANLPITLTSFGIEPPSFANTLKVADDFQIEVQFTAVEQ